MHLKSSWYYVLVLFGTLALSNANAQTLIWRDEFNQTKLDDEKWSREVGGSGFGNGELEYYTSGEQNVFIGSKTNAADTGYLVIEARRENYGIAPENRQFTSGRVNTSGKFNFKYGTIEARIKLPNLQNGLWPAFWMLGANYPTDGWPKSGEMDILEAGFKDDWMNNVANKKNNSTVHWFQDNYQVIDPAAPGDGWYGNASATGSITIPGAFTDGYHLFKLVWTPTSITGYVDNVQYYTFNIPAADVNITEFSSNPFYIIMNLAIGGTNFVGITDPAQITAPLPAQMQIDYIRVYSNASTTVFSAKDLPRQTGKFGVYTETTPVNASLGTAPTIEVWSNLTAASSTAFEGSNVLSFTANPGNWFGLGIPTGATNVKNMQNFIDGALHFQMKTTSTWPMSIGVISTANGNAQGSTQSKTVKLDPAGTTQYGLVRDGQWHEVVIPFSAFGNIEFRSINNMFYIVGDNPTAAVTFAIDNIYWQDGTKITPQNGDYVVYSDTKTGVDKFDIGVDGAFNIWEATLIAQTTTPAEGANVLSFTNNAKGWFGAAFTASAMHNLTAYQNANGKLVFSMKTSDTTTPFYIGMKSGTRDGEGQRWIAFEPGQTPYGFQRNGTWQTVQIPMSDIYVGVNLMEVTQIFEILGTANIANIAIDNIYFTGGATAQPDTGGANVAPNANAGADKTVTLPTNSVAINGSGADSDGTIASYAWTRISGPNTPTLTNANTANLTASGLVAGTYVFRLTVTDNGGLTASDDVNVVVNAANTPPVANAGADKAITLPTNSVVINGTGTDSNGTISAYAWTQVSGPSTATLSGANTANLTASALIAGTYVFRLTVTDNQSATASDDVTVVVSPATGGTNIALNKLTTVSSTENAGTPGSSAVDGNAGTRWSSAAADPQWIYVDLGQTYNVNRVKITWETALGKDYLVQIAATTTGTWTTMKTITGNTVTVNDHTGLTGSGRYVRIYGTARGTAWGYSIWELEVYGTGGPANVAPTANAGADKSITLPTNSVVINGSGTDSDGTIASYAWTRVSGPNTPTLTNANTANLTASGLVAGTYVFRLTVTDNGGLTGFDDVNVVVNTASNVAPTANAGADKAITLPTSSVVINGTGTDSDGTISTYAWTRTSGPNTPTLTNANTANLTASGLIAGTYVFRLTVTDNGGLTGFDEMNVVVSNATTTNIALNKLTTVSSIEAAGTPGSAAVDGNATSRWSSAFSDPQWIYVDLGANYNVNRVKITWEGAYGKDYLVQIATTTTGTWTTMKTVTGNTTLVNDHTALTGMGRYVRIYGTARGTVYGYSIYELEVYGSVAARLAVEELKGSDANSISFYPNPADDVIYIDGVEDGTPVSIITLTGSESLQRKVMNKSVDVSPLQPGAYFLHVRKGSTSVMKKLIKR
jgi:beta-glucanase (GH16 family)